MSTLRITPKVPRSSKQFLKLSNRMLVDPTRIVYLKQLRKPTAGTQQGDVRNWEIGGLTGLADPQCFIISDSVALSLRDQLQMTEVFDSQYQVPILLNMAQIAAVEANGSVFRFYTLENGRRATVLTSMLESAEPLGF